MTKSRKSKNDLFSSLDIIFDGQLSISEMIDCAFSSSSDDNNKKNSNRRSNSNLPFYTN